MGMAEVGAVPLSSARLNGTGTALVSLGIFS